MVLHPDSLVPPEAALLQLPPHHLASCALLSSLQRGMGIGQAWMDEERKRDDINCRSNLLWRVSLQLLILYLVTVAECKKQSKTCNLKQKYFSEILCFLFCIFIRKFEVTFCNSALPFILAQATEKPLARLTTIFLRPQYADVMSSSAGLKEILRPFVGFSLFCVGKISMVVASLAIHIWLPGHTGKPFTVYFMISVIFLSALGLQLFLVFQEYIFYTYCTSYKKVVNILLGKPKENASVEKIAMSGIKNHNIEDVLWDPSSKTTFRETTEDFIDIMENTTKLFGPILLQNFSLMLLYWLLHLYNLLLVVASGIKYYNGFSGSYIALFSLHTAGSALIVW